MAKGSYGGVKLFNGDPRTWDGVNGVGFGDSLDSNGRGGLVFGSGNIVLSSAGAQPGTGKALVEGE